MPKRTELNLNKYLANYTSEDNASFEALVVEDNKKNQAKVFWLEENAKQAAKNIIDRADPTRTGMLDSWTYKVKNELMWFPEGDGVVQRLDKEVVIHKPKTVATNTRFPGGFFDKPSDEDELKLQATADSTPQVGGYKLLRTPQIDPGQGGGAGGGAGVASPFMTWGDIAGTPIHLAEEDEELERKDPARAAAKRGFRVPDTPSRDELGWRLDAKAKAKKRKLTGSRRRSSHRTPGVSTPSPLRSSGKGGNTPKGSDQGLRSFYSRPSPSTKRRASSSRPSSSRLSSARRMTPSPSPIRIPPPSPRPHGT